MQLNESKLRIDDIRQTKITTEMIQEVERI